MYLDTTSKVLEIILGGAVTTNQLEWTADYIDTQNGNTFAPANAIGVTNSATLVTMVSAPAASTQRKISALTVYNADTVAATVTIRMYDGANRRRIVSQSLAAGSTMVYTPEGGWTVFPAGAGSLTAANPTGTGSDTATNGVATTYMRSDATFAIQKATSLIFGLAKADGTTITSAAGVLSAVAPSAKYFLANRTTDQASGAIWTKLICDAFITNNLGTQYDVATGKFTPTTAGLWVFFAVTRMKAATTADSHALSITKNGTWSGSGTQLLIVNSQNSGSSSTAIIEGVIFSSMNGTTDWVEVDGILSISTGGSQNFVGTQCFFGAVYLGP